VRTSFFDLVDDQKNEGSGVLVYIKKAKELSFIFFKKVLAHTETNS